MPIFVILVVIFLNTFNPSSSTTQYNVVDYGAKADGETESTKAFLTAWENACRLSNPSTLYVPSGKFLLRTISFKGPCQNKDISVIIDGTIEAPSDYKVIGNEDYWILFDNVEGVSVSGGILDAGGSALWACKASTQSNCPTGARTLGFSNSRNIEISGLTSLNSQLFHIVIDECHNVKVSGVKVSAPDNSPNTDGIHVQSSSGVTISNSKIGTGDDCISIGPGASNLWIESVACGPGHGISIGSLGQTLDESGLQNVTVTSVTFASTQNGVRIKSWGRPSNGFARNILFQHATMKNVQNPILIDQNYCPNDNDCPGQSSGVKISDVTYQDIHGTSATEVAVKLDCSKKYSCTGIKLEDVKLTYKNQPAEASCDNADGTASGFLGTSTCLL